MSSFNNQNKKKDPVELTAEQAQAIHEEATKALSKIETVQSLLSTLLADVDELYKSKLQEFQGQDALKTQLEAAWELFHINLSLIRELEKERKTEFDFLNAQVQALGDFAEKLTAVNSANASKELSNFLDMQKKYNNFFLNLKEKASPGLEEELKEEALKKRPRTEATSQLDVEELRDSKKHRFAVELSDIESLYEARIKDYQSLLKTLLEAAWSTFNINLQLIDKLKQPHEQYREAEVRLSFYQGLSKLNSVNPSEGLTKLLEDQHVLNQELLKREAELEQTGAGSPVLSNEKVSELSDAQEESGLETPRTQDTVHEERSPVGLSPEQAKQIRKQDVDKALADVESYLLLKANFKDPKPEEEILRMQREGKEGNFSIPLFRYLLIVELKNRFISGETSKENFAQELTKLANDSSMKPRSWYAKCVPWFTSTTHDKLIQAAKKWDKDHPQPR